MSVTAVSILQEPVGPLLPRAAYRGPASVAEVPAHLPTLLPFVIVPGSFSFDVRLQPFLISLAEPADLAREALPEVPGLLE